MAWLATETDRTAITTLSRIAWLPVGAITVRVVDDQLDQTRFDELLDIGCDENSWKKHHNCVTAVVHHNTGDVIWYGKGKDTAALDRFFDRLGPEGVRVT